MLAGMLNECALKLFDIGAVKFGNFRLKLHEKNPDAPLSPFYIDLRILRSYPLVMDLVVSIYQELICNLNFDILADIPTAATPIVTLLSHQIRKPMISPRLDKKQHGTRNVIDGVYTRGQIALLIDDLITKADSKLEAISILESSGLNVNDIVVLVDREQGGCQELQNRGYSCISAFKFTEILQILSVTKKISEADHGRALTYLNNVA